MKYVFIKVHSTPISWIFQDQNHFPSLSEVLPMQ